MDIQFKRIEKIVGTFILCIVILLLTMVIIIGRGKDWFKKYTTYYTTFSEGYNLEINTPVKLFKTDIGKVKEITLAGDRVKVKLAIMEEYTIRIRTDSYVIVESPTIIGSEYVSLRPGSAYAALIPEEGVIPSRKKKTIADMLSEFEVERTAKMIVKAAQDLSELVRTIKDPQGPLFSILGNVDRISSHIEGITRDIQEGKGTAGGRAGPGTVGPAASGSAETNGATAGSRTERERLCARSPVRKGTRRDRRSAQGSGVVRSQP